MPRRLLFACLRAALSSGFSSSDGVRLLSTVEMAVWIACTGIRFCMSLAIITFFDRPRFL